MRYKLKPLDPSKHLLNTPKLNFSTTRSTIVLKFFYTGSSQSLSEKRSLRFVDMLLPGVLVLSLLFAQSVNLNHTHSGDLSDRVDCDICLKIGSSDDVLVSTSLLPVIKAPATAYSSETLDPFNSVDFQAKARAPPLT